MAQYLIVAVILLLLALAGWLYLSTTVRVEPWPWKSTLELQKESVDVRLCAWNAELATKESRSGCAGGVADGLYAAAG